MKNLRKTNCTMRICFTSFLYIVFAISLHAQSPYVLRNTVEHNILDRIEILNLSDTFLVSSVNNFDAGKGAEMLLNIWNKQNYSEKEKDNLEHYFQQYVEFLPEKKEQATENSGLFMHHNTEDPLSTEMHKNYFDRKPILKYFYKTRAHFLQFEAPSLKLYINPVFNIRYTEESQNSDIVFQNTRGAEIKGYIENKVYFYAQILENQRSFPSYVQASIDKYSAIPGQGFSKGFQSSLIKNLQGYDYFNARSYIGFNPIKSIQLELGHGNHFIGNGVRSLLLSDFSHPYFYFKMNTRIWKFHYQNLFNELSPISTLISRGGDHLLPKKYTATHYLAFKPNHHFEIGLFETVIFGRENHFEFQYLNPIILYRAVEHFLGSPDNVMLGLNVKWNFLNKFSLYGQLIVDEFKINEVFNSTGWWANKFGGQIGLKYINVFGIDQMDLQLEYNAVRPYTYTHRDTLSGFSSYSVANYSNHNQPLAHPLGANFREIIVLLRYKPFKKLYLQARLIQTVYGDDEGGNNWGQNILVPNNNPQMEYGNFIGQGLKTKIWNTNLDVSYAFYHNCFIDVRYQNRVTFAYNKLNTSLYTVGVRINMQDISIDY